MTTELILGLLAIIGINIILSGDNAVVIAMACRNLPEKYKKKAMFLGSGLAIVIRIGLTFIAAYLMEIPYVTLIGGVLLLYIAIKLLVGGEEDGKEGGATLGSAIKTIIGADFIMSLDNVLAVAGASQGHIGLMITGLLISIPLIVWGSNMLMKLMNRFPIIVTLGAALLGYTAGEMILKDKFVAGLIDIPHLWHNPMAIGLGIVVIIIGKIIESRKEAIAQWHTQE